MYRSTVAAFTLTVALGGCHPPDQAIYDRSKTCVGILDVAFHQVPSNELRKAGLYRDDVDKAALGSYEDALVFGANTGLAKSAIMKEVAQAKEEAWKSYALPASPAAAKPSKKLLNAVKECMPKPGGPND